eukprot:gene7203-5063_t
MSKVNTKRKRGEKISSNAREEDAGDRGRCKTDRQICCANNRSPGAIFEFCSDQLLEVLDSLHALDLLQHGTDCRTHMPHHLGANFNLHRAIGFICNTQTHRFLCTSREASISPPDVPLTPKALITLSLIPVRPRTATPTHRYYTTNFISSFDFHSIRNKAGVTYYYSNSEAVCRSRNRYVFLLSNNYTPPPPFENNKINNQRDRATNPTPSQPYTDVRQPGSIIKKYKLCQHIDREQHRADHPRGCIFITIPHNQIGKARKICPGTRGPASTSEHMSVTSAQGQLWRRSLFRRDAYWAYNAATSGSPAPRVSRDSVISNFCRMLQGSDAWRQAHKVAREFPAHHHVFRIVFLCWGIMRGKSAKEGTETLECASSVSVHILLVGHGWNGTLESSICVTRHIAFPPQARAGGYATSEMQGRYVQARGDRQAPVSI